MDWFPDRCKKISNSRVQFELLTAIRARKFSLDHVFDVVLQNKKIIVIPRHKFTTDMLTISPITEKQIMEGFTTKEWNRLVRQTIEAICLYHLEEDYVSTN